LDLNLELPSNPTGVASASAEQVSLKRLSTNPILKGSSALIPNSVLLHGVDLFYCVGLLLLKYPVFCSQDDLSARLAQLRNS